MSEYRGDAPEQRGVYAFALEDVVNVLTVAEQFSREPSHAALLSAQFLLDTLTDMYHAGWCLASGSNPHSPNIIMWEMPNIHNGRRIPTIAYPDFKVFAQPLQIDKQTAVLRPCALHCRHMEHGHTRRRACCLSYRANVNANGRRRKPYLLLEIECAKFKSQKITL